MSVRAEHPSFFTSEVSNSQYREPEAGESVDGLANSEEATLERPSLQLQDVEGRIHRYEGLLSRKTKKAKLKSGWKKRWFRVSPGKACERCKLASYLAAQL